jgi:hypothetical protein
MKSDGPGADEKTLCISSLAGVIDAIQRRLSRSKAELAGGSEPVRQRFCISGEAGEMEEDIGAMKIKSAKKKVTDEEYYDNRGVLSEIAEGEVVLSLDDALKQDILSGKRKRKLGTRLLPLSTRNV